MDRSAKVIVLQFCLFTPISVCTPAHKNLSANIYLLSSKSSTSGRQANLYVSAFCDLELGDAFRRRFPGPNSHGAASIYRHPPPSRNYLPPGPQLSNSDSKITNCYNLAKTPPTFLIVMLLTKRRKKTSRSK